MLLTSLGQSNLPSLKAAPIRIVQSIANELNCTHFFMHEIWQNLQIEVALLPPQTFHSSLRLEPAFHLGLDSRSHLKALRMYNVAETGVAGFLIPLISPQKNTEKLHSRQDGKVQS